MEKGTVVLRFPGPVTLEFAAFAEALQKASHRLRAIVVEVSGRFEAPDQFVVAGTAQRLRAELGAIPPPDGTVRVRATLDRWDAPVLRVQQVRPLR